MTFEYLQRVVVDSELDIEDIGECCVRGRNDFGEEFYLVVHSEMGFTTIYEYGTATPDIEMLPDNVTIKCERFPYNQNKIINRIDKFLNDSKRFITQADTPYVGEVMPYMINPIDKIFPMIKKGDMDE